MTVLFTLTSAGLDTGPFNLYSNLDGFLTPFEVGISKATLVGGFSSANVPDYTTVVRIQSAGTCGNWIDIILENTTTSTTTGTPTTSSSTSTSTTTIANIPCGVSAGYSGGQNYPSSEVIGLGSDTGPVVLQFDAISVPDRYIVRWNGSIVIDTGYRGSNIYSFGGYNRSGFKTSLLGKVDPVTSNIYPDFTTYPDDGYPLIVGTGSGIDSFVKSLAAPSTAEVEVYGPMSGTAWSFTLYCPNTGPTTTSTTTGIPATTTSTTTGTPTTTTTFTTDCICKIFEITVTAEDLINASGNTDNPSLNGKVFVTYINCLGDVDENEYTNPGVNSFCANSLTTPLPTYWRNNIEESGSSSLLNTGESCC